MKHIGQRPEHSLVVIDDGRARVTYHEIFPEGGYRIWNNRLLRSGCGESLTELKENDSLLYCPVCEEWCNKNQFE